MTLRENIIDLLALYASPKQQFEYEKEVPIANVPQELLSMWFDPDNKDIKLAFNLKEHRSLSEFTGYFNERLKYIPQFDGVTGLQQNRQWLEIQKYAKSLLDINKWNTNL